ncbi:hypothetical protein XH93_14370 [Bradyrhizobium sp. CCBAU 51753]|nr:hypothetical protein XH93_14370 [Bradyrhizobium sp. CCBAU 51753]
MAPLSLTLSRIRLRQGFGGQEGRGNPAAGASLTCAIAHELHKSRLEAAIEAFVFSEITLDAAPQLTV